MSIEVFNKFWVLKIYEIPPGCICLAKTYKMCFYALHSTENFTSCTKLIGILSSSNENLFDNFQENLNCNQQAMPMMVNLKIKNEYT